MHWLNFKAHNFFGSINHSPPQSRVRSARGEVEGGWSEGGFRLSGRELELLEDSRSDLRREPELREDLSPLLRVGELFGGSA